MLDVEHGLIGHWPLAADVEERIGHLPRGSVSGPIVVGPEGARFDGLGRIVMAGVPAGALDGDLTIAAMVRLDDPVGASVGDIVARYDPVTRRGFSLGVTHGTSTGSQRNDRNLTFGIDGGSEPHWVARGRPGEALYAHCLAVFQGDLYVGTYEDSGGRAGGVYRYDGQGGWVDTHAPVRSNGVSALAVLGDALYAGTTRMIGAGSALPESSNQTPGGEILRYRPTDGWASCGRLAGHDTVGSMATLGSDLFASPSNTEGVYRYDGGTSWESIGTPGRRLIALGAYRGALYGAGNDHADVGEAMAKTRAGIVVPPRAPGGGGGVFRWDGGTTWTLVGMQPDTTQVYSIAVHDDAMHVGTWPNGLVFRYAEPDRWASCGRLGDQTEVMGMVAYNGKLYGGTVPLAQVYRFDAPGSWTLTGRLDHTEDALYRRAASMAIYDGRLFCGTLPSGMVWSMDAGTVASHDTALDPGWRHVVAVRRGRDVRIHVDGREVARRRGDSDLDIANDQPLVIGGGPQGGFTGWLRDIQLYDRALDDSRIASLVDASTAQVV